MSGDEGIDPICAHVVICCGFHIHNIACTNSFIVEFHTKLFSGDGSSDMYIITSLLAISYRGSITYTEPSTCNMPWHMPSQF